LTRKALGWQAVGRGMIADMAELED